MITIQKGTGYAWSDPVNLTDPDGMLPALPYSPDSGGPLDGVYRIGSIGVVARLS